MYENLWLIKHKNQYYEMCRLQLSRDGSKIENLEVG
jgi:hypothetical protein